MDSSEDEEEKPRGGKPEASPARSQGSAGGRSRSGERAVPIEQVQTLSQMARLAPDLERRLKRGDVRSRELREVAAALSRSRYFDGGLFEALNPELKRAFEKRRLGMREILDIICDLTELNAYDAGLFEAACATLEREIGTAPDSEKLRLEVALKRVGHDAGGLAVLLKAKRSGDNRQACPMFFRGQCKWGPKCKLSHDPESFERAAEEGSWKPPSQSGGKSVGYKQSSDLFKADRCGALW